MSVEPDKIIKSKVEILKRLGYRYEEFDGAHNLVHIHEDGNLMAPREWPDFLSALNAAWDDAMERYDLYIDKGGNFHRKLHGGRSAASGMPVIVVEQLWPFDKEVLVFEPPSELISLRTLANEVKTERATGVVSVIR